jgi:hypothetical protein
MTLNNFLDLKNRVKSYYPLFYLIYRSLVLVSCVKIENSERDGSMICFSYESRHKQKLEHRRIYFGFFSTFSFVLFFYFSFCLSLAHALVIMTSKSESNSIHYDYQ